MRAFEIHTLGRGKWKIDSVFDDRELALFEAGRMETSRRFSGIRVIEENFDEDSQKTTTRTIFRGSTANGAKAKPKTKGGGGAKAGKAARGKAPARNAKRKKTDEKKKSSLGFMIGILALSICVGIGAIIALRVLSDSI
ncbi:MAG: hypothetical protein ACTSQV_09140 [Alphaproteobacteria bacterium]